MPRVSFTLTDEEYEMTKQNAISKGLYRPSVLAKHALIQYLHRYPAKTLPCLKNVQIK